MRGWSRWDVFVAVAIATIGAAVLILTGIGAAVLILTGLALGLIV